MAWSAADIPDLTGRTVVVTGANSGLGAATARQLARHGATVVLACRNVAKAEVFAASLAGPAGGAGPVDLERRAGRVVVQPLDLADLASVRAFAAASGPVDVLINNAEVMAVPMARTADGFELQFGTNFLGHFALTGLLLPGISSRVVTLSSLMHRFGRIELDDLNWHRRRYRRWAAYSQSKLADLMFAGELQRRLTIAGSPVLSLAAHPGYAATGLQSHTESALDQLMGLGNRILAQDAESGALPALYAATMPDVSGGDYYGPSGPGEVRGAPRTVGRSRAAADAGVAAALWRKAEALTGVTYP